MDMFMNDTLGCSLKTMRRKWYIDNVQRVGGVKVTDAIAQCNIAARVNLSGLRVHKMQLDSSSN
jgi:hypothetical protein